MNRLFLLSITFFVLLVFPMRVGDEALGDSEEDEPPITLGSYDEYIEIVGDGHMHTVYSGRVSSVNDCTQKAQERNLDWIFITDYDTVAAKQNCTEETNETFICGLGEEVQVYEGEPPEVKNEIIAWGINSVVDGHTNANYTLGDIIDEIHEQGGLAYLPHPCAPDEDDNYDYFGVYDDFDAMSIYHGYGGFNDNAISTAMDGDALRKWDEYLNMGMRKTAVGESDSKNAQNTPDYGDLFNMQGAIGYPRNYIYAREFSVRGIIEAVRSGRVYVTDGPTMNFTIDGHIMGETIYADSPSLLNINISGVAVENSDVRIIKNGTLIYSQSVSPGPFSVSYGYSADSDSYFRTEVRTFNGDLFTGETNLSFSNPIYFDLSPYEEMPLPPSNLEAWVNASDIVLNWTSSPSPDVMHYNIYRSETRNGFDFTYPYALTSKTTWTDKGAGDGDMNNYYYIVRAVDKALYKDANLVKTAKYVKPVNFGWNMVSTPLIMSKTDPKEVLQTVNDSFENALIYDASDKIDQWKSTLKGDLVKINNSLGLWVYANSSDYLITAGIVPDITVIPLYTGWNFVGYPSYTNLSFSQALSGVNWENLQSFDSKDTQGDFWKHNATNKPDSLNDLDMFKTGNGYWLYVTQDGPWTVFA